MKNEEFKPMNEREKAIYKAGYTDGKDDALDMLEAALTYIHKYPNCDPTTPTGFAEIVAAAERRLREKGSAMTLIRQGQAARARND